MTVENSIKLGKDDSSVFSVTTINSNVLYRYSLKIAGLPTLWTRCTAVRTVCAMSSKEAPVHPNEEQQVICVADGRWEAIVRRGMTQGDGGRVLQHCGEDIFE